MSQSVPNQGTLTRGTGHTTHCFSLRYWKGARARPRSYATEFSGKDRTYVLPIKGAPHTKRMQAFDSVRTFQYDQTQVE